MRTPHIIACQESNPAFANAIRSKAKNGNFSVVWPGFNARPGVVEQIKDLVLRRYPNVPAYSNLVIVPKRYEILSTRAVGFARIPSVENERRGYLQLRLKDRRTGGAFTLIATHLSYQPQVRALEGRQLARAIAEAKKRGRVVVLGDFNTTSRQANYNHNRSISQFWDGGIQDVDPRAATMSDGEDSDHVMVDGFGVAKTDVLNGKKMTIPGRDDASKVSDHYAHEAWLTWS
jgi:endonuclease/exonuclease/phosphatase family metal-dependent hydrolase